MIGTPASRREAWVGGPHVTYGPDPFPDPTVITLAIGVDIDEGAWLTAASIPLGFGVTFNTDFGQADWSVTLQGQGITFDNAVPLPWSFTLPGEDITLEAGAFRKADLTPYAITLPGYGISIPQDMAVTLPGVGISFDTANAVALSASYCYNLHAEGGAECTRFTNFDFIRILRVNGTNYGLKADGIYTIGGTTDNGTAISSSFTLSPNTYGDTHLKRCPWVHGGFNAAGNVYALTDTDGSEVYTESAAFAVGLGAGNARRAQLARGLKSGLWGFRIANSAGGRLKVAWIEFDFEILSKRI
jgi:hypothetical protein